MANGGHVVHGKWGACGAWHMGGHVVHGKWHKLYPSYAPGSESKSP